MPSQGLGPDWAHYHFCFILLPKSSHRTEPTFKGWGHKLCFFSEIRRKNLMLNNLDVEKGEELGPLKQISTFPKEKQVCQ